MSTLAKLKFVNATRQVAVSPLLQRRNKLASKIAEQAELLKAQLEGRVYAPKRLKYLKDRETGQRIAVEATKRVKEWYWLGEGNKIHLEIRYGSKCLKLNSKGANAIEVSDKEELLATLQLLQQATIAGDLDIQIEAASKSLRDSFKS